MIKISIDKKAKIKIENEIYGSKSKLFINLKKRMQKMTDSSNEITKHMFLEWFVCKQRGTNVELSDEKIMKFLLNDDLLSLIEEYAKFACKAICRNESFYRAYLHYKRVTMDASKIDDKRERLALLKRESILTPDNIGMFTIYEVTDVENDKGNKANQKEIKPIRVLNSIDLDDSVPDDALCANTKWLKNLDLTRHKDVEDFIKDCKKIFDYSEFSREYRGQLLSAMGVSVCPYCNRQYITPVGAENPKRHTADIDHFYFKDRYPFLALSLYNFVPSCQICNSRCKGSKDFYLEPHVNPHQRGFDREGHFEIEGIKSFMRYKEKPKVKLVIAKGDEQVENSVSTFKLRELYTCHEDYAMEIVRKMKYFNKSKLEEYKKAYGDMFPSTEEVYMTVFGDYLDKEKQGNRPLVKYTQDLVEKLELIVRNDKQSKHSSGDAAQSQPS